MSEIAEYKNSEVCQSCANCCKVYASYVEDEDIALRIAMIDTPDNEIQIVKVRDGLWRVTFDFPCRNLIKKDDKYYCLVYNSIRPDMCKTYPNNFNDQPNDVLEVESRVCMLMKDIINSRE